MKDIAIKVSNVNKTFKLPHEKNNTIKSAVVKFYSRKKTYDIQHTLIDVSFEVKKGEFFGVVGRNGSGKSTLLKLLAGIYSPDSGVIEINGSLTPFIELGVGFNPDLTGRENVFLNGALLGFNRKDMHAMYDDIVEFAELEKFMDQKLKNYSSGMQVRLAFSIAIRAKSDILVLDEVLAVGDENFQKKCITTFRQMKNLGVTVILVSHDMNLVEQFCEKAILIDKGKKVFYGKSTEAAQKYQMLNREHDKNKNLVENDLFSRKRVDNSEGLGLVSIDTKLIDKKGKEKHNVDSSEPIIIESTFTAHADITKALHSFTFEDMEGRTISLFSTDQSGVSLFDMKKGEKKTIVTEIENIFKEGIYYIDPDVSTTNREIIYGHVDNACSFEVIVHQKNPHLLRPNYDMK
jgi:ABC-2 type transport system ATP-binding protein